MPDARGSRTPAQPSFLQRTLVVAGVVVFVLLLWAWRDVVLLAFASILIANGLHGIADPLRERARVGRGAALAVAALVVSAILAGIVWLFGALLASQISELSAQLPAAWERMRETLSQTPIGAGLAEDLQAWVAGAAQFGVVCGVAARFGGYTLSVASALTNVVLVLFAAVFFASAPGTYVEGTLKLVPRGLRADLKAALAGSSRALKKWMLGTLISMLAIMLMMGIALAFLGVPSFIALAMIAGLAQFVPVAGPLLAAIPGVLLALTVGPETALWTAIAYFSASQLEANVIYPVIQQRAVQMPPAVTLFAIIAMGLLFGPLGVLLATPIMVVAAVFIVQLYVRGVLNEEMLLPGEKPSQHSS